MSDNTIRYPSKFTKKEVRQMLGTDGNDQRSVWHYGDYDIWFLHIANQRPTGGWISTAENGRINIWYQDKNDALIIEMLNGYDHYERNDRLTLVFASHDENTEYEFKGVFKTMSDTDDGVIDHIFKRICKEFDIDEKKAVVK